MPRIKTTFPNGEGMELTGALELPDDPPRAYALFAHCFTCSKDVAAATRIARGLAERGIAVLRFDFTGLGNSEGDFANTDFSSNVADLVAAAEFLEREYRPPEVLIGHSLGGAAVLAAAHAIPGSRALVTIGAPATADHLEHLLGASKETILAHERAEVTLAGRRFTIRRQLLEDIAEHNTTDHIARLDKALLVFHSPVDELVSIDEAARIYQAARHPKSFVSLDRADHLLTRPEDSEYVAAVLGAWAGRYVGATAPGARARPDVAAGEVLVSEQHRAYTRDVYTAHHRLLADEPLDLGGADRGPNPYELLLAALGACTSITVRMYADRKELPLEDVEVRLQHGRIHAKDCEECESKDSLVDRIDKRIRLRGDLSDQQRERLLQIADRCPVNRTLLNEILIKSELLP